MTTAKDREVTNCLFMHLVGRVAAAESPKRLRQAPRHPQTQPQSSTIGSFETPLIQAAGGPLDIVRPLDLGYGDTNSIVYLGLAITVDRMGH